MPFTDDGWADSHDSMRRAYNAHQDKVRSRSTEFISGHDDARPDLRAGTQDDHWANQRYGDQSQLPTSGPRRAGPLPYPETHEDHLRSVEDLRWSRAH